MKYITLDTCVWLELLKADLHNDDNVFEEMCYWIEHKFLTHITPENLIREWDRRKVKKSQEIIKNIKDLEKTTIGALKGNPDLISAYKPDAVSGKINKRIERVDLILKVHSEIAKENLTVYKDAIKRNLDCLAPNHRADSFRDTINILSLTDYIIKKGYEKCCFSTINYTDFSIGKQKKYDLHSQLADDFQKANLQYVFFDEDPVGGKLMNTVLRPVLPSFNDFLKENERKEQDKILADKKEISDTKIEAPDKDYLENIKYIDLILSKKTRTAFEDDLIKSLIQRHDSYKQYFFKNVGNNGLV